ncbi:hypothetical protein NDU88_000727 [Pleurodeles waltl]|uniref:Uncharacterized protein n=1 Tax=Pleurodeles waltl TaxID=8319 RepID=A0AAV7SX85_PLEWA|nr:hypothetical protein NDU88_000727 [Pleurodeles waltl]
MAGRPKSAKNQDRSTQGQAPGDQHHTPSLQSLESTLMSHSSQFEKVLQAIMDTKTSLETRIDTVSQDLNILRVDHGKLSDKMKTTEAALSELAPTVADNQKQILRLNAEVKSLLRRAEEAEGRSRRNNIRFLGFPEKSLDQSSELLLEHWLIKELHPNSSQWKEHTESPDAPRHRANLRDH